MCRARCLGNECVCVAVHLCDGVGVYGDTGKVKGGETCTCVPRRCAGVGYARVWSEQRCVCKCDYGIWMCTYLWVEWGICIAAYIGCTYPGSAWEEHVCVCVYVWGTV